MLYIIFAMFFVDKTDDESDNEENDIRKSYSPHNEELIDTPWDSFDENVQFENFQEIDQNWSKPTTQQREEDSEFMNNDFLKILKMKIH